MMHKYIISATIFFMFFVNLQSQPINQNVKQNIETQKVAFITQKLNLTVEEAQLFWPVYNEFMNNKESLLNKKKSLLQKFNTQSEKLSDSELENLADENIEIQVKEAELAKTYHQKFKTVLPIKKVVKYYQAENQFKRVILNQYKKNNNQPKRNFRQN